MAERSNPERRAGQDQTPYLSFGPKAAGHHPLDQPTFSFGSLRDRLKGRWSQGSCRVPQWWRDQDQTAALLCSLSHGFQKTDSLPGIHVWLGNVGIPGRPWAWASRTGTDVITSVWAPKINSDSAGGSLRGVDTCGGLPEEASFHLVPAAHQAGGAGQRAWLSPSF